MYKYFRGFCHLSAGLALGFSGLAAGIILGLAGDAYVGVRNEKEDKKSICGLISVCLVAFKVALFGFILHTYLYAKK